MGPDHAILERTGAVRGLQSRHGHDGGEYVQRTRGILSGRAGNRSEA